MQEQDPLHASAGEADQLSFHMEEIGSGDAICILLHGFADAGYVWYDFAPRLPKNYRALILDFRGHGNSVDNAAANYGVGPYAIDVLNLIQKSI
jgi:pimeloyl-ACP methyl ester carboxylesterase